MNWTNYFDAIYLINLLKREDRLLQMAEQFSNYDIPYKRVGAIEKHKGAEGLRDTMLDIFNEAQEKGYENILVFEDDAKFVLQKQLVDETMGKVIKQLPENYMMCFLGGQPTGGYTRFHSPNLLPVNKYYSTHAVMYSKKCINEILARELGYPIDNWYCDVLQPMGGSFAIDPILCTQRAGYSDIGKNEINWDLFIQPKHEQEINKLRSRC